jgi:putative transposase
VRRIASMSIRSVPHGIRMLLVVLGVREDGQKALLAVKNMGGEAGAAWRAGLDDLVKRGLRKPEFLIVDGETGLEQALASLWDDVFTQRFTVHKHRNLLAHAPQRLHDEISADYYDMIYATSAAQVEQRERAFVRKWRLKCKAVADSLKEAGDRLFTFTRLPLGQSKSARTTNAIEAVLGVAGRRSDHHTQSRRMADVKPEAR